MSDKTFAIWRVKAQIGGEKLAKEDSPHGQYPPLGFQPSQVEQAFCLCYLDRNAGVYALPFLQSRARASREKGLGFSHRVPFYEKVLTRRSKGEVTCGVELSSPFPEEATYFAGGICSVHRCFRRCRRGSTEGF